HLPMCSFTASLLPLSYLLFSVIRAPPAPTLVPYTTLFRSVLGHSGQQGGVVDADGRVVERDPADHGRAGRENGVGPAVHRRELAQADGVAGAGDVDGLSVARQRIHAHGLLRFAGEAVPTAAGTGRSDEREVRGQIALRPGGPHRVRRD